MLWWLSNLVTFLSWLLVSSISLLLLLLLQQVLLSPLMLQPLLG
jgi:hypothetical protein